MRTWTPLAAAAVTVTAVTAITAVPQVIFVMEDVDAASNVVLRRAPKAETKTTVTTKVIRAPSSAVTDGAELAPSRVPTTGISSTYEKTITGGLSGGGAPSPIRAKSSGRTLTPPAVPEDAVPDAGVLVDDVADLVEEESKVVTVTEKGSKVRRSRTSLTRV